MYFFEDSCDVPPSVKATSILMKPHVSRSMTSKMAFTQTSHWQCIEEAFDNKMFSGLRRCLLLPLGSNKELSKARQSTTVAQKVFQSTAFNSPSVFLLDPIIIIYSQ
jgi:hypothetical protein